MMTIHRRRAHDPEDPQTPRREDILEELLKNGSRNFRAYRRRAYWAFAGLTLANALAIGWVYDTRNDANKNNTERQMEIARQQKDVSQILVEVQNGRSATLNKICAIDNGQNAGISKILVRFKVDASAFAPIDCAKLADSANVERKPKVKPHSK
jgi:hypothetical protein